MRCKITIQKTSSTPIHYDYQYGLASMLYKRLANANITLANELHSHQGFKFYTFSNIVIEDRIPDKCGLNFTKAHFFISSPDSEFIRSFAEGLLMEPEFFLGRDRKADFVIESIEMLPQQKLTDSCTFTTL
ncbi:MAG: CRISPR-associated endoribonuclease Cas6, partial [Methanolobus sp.]|nr:CRISPR-associated endoribonuclease Cas6 [Methanolobus sp.]